MATVAQPKPGEEETRARELLFDATKQLSGVPVILIVVGFWLAFASLLAVPRVQASPAALWTVIGVLAFFAVAYPVVFIRAKKRGQILTMQPRLRMTHVVQMILHTGVYVYWGYHWDHVLPQVPFILGQLIFGYLIETLIGFIRFGNYRLGLGPVPITGSTNLFLWLRDPLYGVQLGMIALSVLAKEFIFWQRDGQRTHIFNPSAISLFVVTFVLLLTGQVHQSWGPEIASTLGYGPYMYDVIFFVGFVAQLFFSGVGVVTGSAALSLVAYTALYQVITGGVFFVDTSVPIAVFLGMSLLVTDPVSSPYSYAGKVLYGMVYSAFAMLLYVVLIAMEMPATFNADGTLATAAVSVAFLDKLLQVPLMNLTVKYFDKVGRKLDGKYTHFNLKGFPLRAAHGGIWLVAYIAVRGTMVHNAGAHPDFWLKHCEDVIEKRGDVAYACENYEWTLSVPCEKGIGEACHNIGVMYEHGEGHIKADAAIAANYYDRACKLGLQNSCSALGGLFMRSERPDLQVKARALFKAACEAKDAEACKRWAVSAAQGLGGPAAPEEVERAHKLACEAGDTEACAP